MVLYSFWLSKSIYNRSRVRHGRSSFTLCGHNIHRPKPRRLKAFLWLLRNRNEARTPPLIISNEDNTQYLNIMRRNLFARGGHWPPYVIHQLNGPRSRVRHVVPPGPSLSGSGVAVEGVGRVDRMWKAQVAPLHALHNQHVYPKAD